MALDQPNIFEVYLTIKSTLESNLGQEASGLKRAFIDVLSRALAAVYIVLYKYGGFNFLQMFVSQASFDETTVNGRVLTPLIEWGRLLGVGDPSPGTQAELGINITVENQGGSLQAGTQLTSNKNGFTYITKAEVLLDSAIVQADIIAVNDPDDQGGVGTLGNLAIDDLVSFVNPIGDVSREAVVYSIITTAADAETENAYRLRVIDRFQKRPQGGAAVDYEFWGEQAAGIVNVYPYTGLPGEVDVYSESATEPDGIPTQAQLDDVKEQIEKDDTGLASRRPITAFVNSLPISRRGFDVDVINLDVQNEDEVKTEIESALTQYFLNREPFIDGLTTPPRKDKITRATVIGIIDDAVTARSGTFTTATLTFTGDDAVIEFYILQEGEKAKLVNLTYSFS